MRLFEPKPTRTPILITAAICLGVASLVIPAAAPQYAWAKYVALGLFGLSIAALLLNIRNTFNRRTLAFGLNSATTTVLVLGILGVLNFLAAKYPYKLDLTKGKINTLSEQTSKLFRESQEDIRFVYWGKIETASEARPLLENLKSLSGKVNVEYLDIVKEIARARREGVTKEGVLQVFVGGRETKLDSPDEEKITNAVIKLMRNVSPEICAITGHGERDFDFAEPEGYSIAKQTLEKQNYSFRKLNLVSDGKIPSSCAAIAVLGPTQAFFEPEVTLIRDYLASGGAAVFALDLNLKGTGGADASPEISALLREWSIETDTALVVDPYSQVLNLEATLPVIPVYSKESPITRELQGTSIFPLTRSFRVAKDVRPGLKVSWLAQSTPNAWGEKDFTALNKGRAAFNKGTDLPGPLYVAMAAEGSAASSADDKDKKKTRIVAFGTSLIASNQWNRFGNNLDFFANAVSWLLDDESLISIRKKEEPGGTIQLSERDGALIRVLTVLIAPLAMILFGIAVWWRRKKL